MEILKGIAFELLGFFTNGAYTITGRTQQVTPPEDKVKRKVPPQMGSERSGGSTNVVICCMK